MVRIPVRTPLRRTPAGHTQTAFHGGTSTLGAVQIPVGTPFLSFRWNPNWHETPRNCGVFCCTIILQIPLRSERSWRHLAVVLAVSRQARPADTATASVDFQAAYPTTRKGVVKPQKGSKYPSNCGAGLLAHQQDVPRLQAFPVLNALLRALQRRLAICSLPALRAHRP